MITEVLHSFQLCRPESEEKKIFKNKIGSSALYEFVSSEKENKGRKVFLCNEDDQAKKSDDIMGIK